MKVKEKKATGVLGELLANIDEKELADTSKEMIRIAEKEEQDKTMTTV